MSDVVLLQSSDWKLRLTPFSGVQWLTGEIRRGNEWLHVVPDCRTPSAGSDRAGQDERAPLAAANFHMIPYSNRVRDGQFSFDGKDYQLENAAKHAIHGSLRTARWRIVEQTEQSLVCEYASESDGALNWPWPIHARLVYALNGRQLESEMSLTNKGASRMPCGMGWHPYFNRHVAGASPVLTIPVTHVYPDETGDTLPDGPAVTLPEPLDFTSARALDPDQRIDCCLSGLNGNCHIAWPDASVALTMKASANCTHLVLFNPDMPHFAVEPVTNATDAFNLANQNIDGGVTVLAPGESLNATMSISLDT